MGLDLKEVATDIVVGALGGAAGNVVGQPFDVIKTRMQVQASPARSLVAHCKELVAEYGVLGFFRGLTPPLAGAAFYQATCFASYNAGLRLYEWGWRAASDEDMSKVVAAGVFSGVVTVLVTTPMEVFKIALQVKQTKSRSGDFVAMLRSGAVHPYKGCLAVLARDAPTTGFYFYVYEKLTRQYGFDEFTAGGAAGAGAWTLAIPADVVKTKVQASPAHLPVGECVRGIYAARGWRGFFAGGLPIVLRAFPVNAVAFKVYHDGKRMSAECW
eukprot:TRINITY_DN21049_c0_g1_i1.p1 TRINITY_DN21049_c0_g1~~TRINITY_DN21049_c0_g1_i1.p1  ORF type:complete len:271 (+),score=87.22 TRINITY_DN21049_c0_g1_i1:99-911(+)